MQKKTMAYKRSGKGERGKDPKIYRIDLNWLKRTHQSHQGGLGHFWTFKGERRLT